ncbi:MAG: hydroxymethylglutaryl-CoA lyase [Myxococcales bacterium]|nr:hydroxymethylglutaryl-CoA lyase [Myxococcales bacterium]
MPKFSFPQKVSVYEVSPRDGLQNESVTLPTTRKLRLIEALLGAGIARIEVTSFVAPSWVPQLADAEQVVGGLDLNQARFSALCPNLKGLERARAAGIHEIAVFVSASDTHNRKNVNATITDTLSNFRVLVPQAVSSGLKVRGYVSTVWGCPYEGVVSDDASQRLCQELLGLGCYQVSLGDTIGVATPLDVARTLELYTSDIAQDRIALHLHDTRGTALANVLMGLQMGVRTFDSAVAGLGGCPYAPGAAGNLATEDLVYMLRGMGIQTGIDLEKLWEAGRVAEAIVGRRLPGKVHQAGVRSLRR